MSHNPYSITIGESRGRLPFREEYSEAGKRETYASGQTCLPCLAHIGRVHYTRALAELPRHYHPDCIEICYLRKGRLSWVIDGETVHIEPEQVVVLQPGQIHGGEHSMMQPCELFFMILDLKANDSPSQIAELCREIQKRDLKLLQTGDFVRQAFDALLDDCRTLRTHQKGRSESWLFLLLDHLLSVADTLEAQLLELSPGVRRALDYIEQSDDPQPSIESVIRASGLGRSEFYRHFTEEIQVPLNHYLTHRTIRQAEWGLLHSNQSITEIALDLGYSSSQYFSTVFKKHIGLTPREYRATSRCSNPSVERE